MSSLVQVPVRMRRLFGQKTEAAPEPTLGDAGDRLEVRATSIDAKVKRLDDELMQLRAQMQRTRGPQQERLKQRALQVLKQRKMYDQHRAQVSQQQMTVDQLQFTREMMEDTNMQVQAMRESKRHLERAFKKFSPDEVERLHDDLADLYEQHQEVQEAMGRAYGVDEAVDEADLQEELDALAFDMDKQADTAYIDEALATPASRLPDTAPGVPTDAVPAATVPPQQTTTDPYSIEAQLGL